MVMFDANTEVNLNGHGGSVDLLATRITHNWDNLLKIQDIPSKLSGDEKLTWLIDLGMTKEVITVEGIIIDDDSLSAITRKSTLKSIIEDTKGNTTIRRYF